MYILSKFWLNKNPLMRSGTGTCACPASLAGPIPQKLHKAALWGREKLRFLPKKTGPRGGRLGFRCRLLPLEAPARHAGVEHGYGAVDHVGQFAAWRPEKGKKVKVTSNLLLV
jgi:hypothetical protein